MSKVSLKAAAARRMELADTEAGKPVIQENVNTVIRKTGKRVNRKSVNTGTQENRIKCTYELAPATVEALEGARLKLRRMAGRNVKRYEIIEAALALALEDLERMAAVLNPNPA